MDEAARVEIPEHVRGAPVDRDGARQERVRELLSDIAVGLGILEGDVKTVARDEARLVRDAAADVVEEASAGVYPATSVQLFEEPIPGP